MVSVSPAGVAATARARAASMPASTLMLLSGLGVAVADAAIETREHAHYVTKAAGGSGAVREVIELILKAQDRWSDLIRVYLRESAANI